MTSLFTLREYAEKNNVDNMEKYLLSLDSGNNLEVSMADLIATSIVYNNTPIISLLNNFIREHKIIMNKEDIFYYIHVSECRKTSANSSRQSCVHYCPFDSDYYRYYYDKYPQLLEYKQLK